MEAVGVSLSSLVDHAKNLRQVRKADMRVGDLVYVKTYNSVYVISVLGEGQYAVSGGWFDRNNLSQMTIRINGCSWGGSAIKVDVVAACGLCIEFGNKVTTSIIQKIFVLQSGSKN